MLVQLASVIDVSISRSVPVELLDTPNIESVIATVLPVETSASWMDIIDNYSREGSLPEAVTKAHKLKTKATRFCLIDNKIYSGSLTMAYTCCT